MSITDAFNNLQLAMDQIKEHLSLLENPANAIAAASASTTAAHEQKSQIEAQLRTARADHDRAIAAAEEKLRDLNATHVAKSKELTDQLNLLRRSYDDWQAKIRSSEERHNQIEARLAAMRQRFA